MSWIINIFFHLLLIFVNTIREVTATFSAESLCGSDTGPGLGPVDQFPDLSPCWPSTMVSPILVLSLEVIARHVMLKLYLQQ